MGWRRSKFWWVIASVFVWADSAAQGQMDVDAVSASSEYIPVMEESRRENSERFQRERLPGASKTPAETEALRKPRDYREKPPKSAKEQADTTRYQQKDEQTEEQPIEEPLWKKPWFRNTMIGLALAAVAVLLWFLFAGTLGLRNQGHGRLTGFEDEIAPEVDLGADYHALSLHAEQEGDLRAALRFRFLELLRNLHLKGWIKLEPGKTNRQYLRDAESFSKIDGCRALTRAYERAWFGRILPETTEYKILASAVDALIQGMERKPL